MVDISKVKSAEVNAYLNRSLASNSNSQDKWIEFYPFLEGIDWKNIYQLPYKILLDSYLIILQYKIMHRVSTCNLNLHKWGIKPTPDCILCGQIDNLEHYFYYCKEVNTFWIQISDWLSTLLYPQTKVGDISDSGPSRRRRRRRNFLVDAITQKQINIFFSNLVHMLRVPKGRSLF